MNTTSFTAFNGAFLHFFYAIYTEDTADELPIAEALQDMLRPHVTAFYAYPNLSNDPNPGTHPGIRTRLFRVQPCCGPT